MGISYHDPRNQTLQSVPRIALRMDHCIHSYHITDDYRPAQRIYNGEHLHCTAARTVHHITVRIAVLLHHVTVENKMT